jgi:hypothetical protein
MCRIPISCLPVRTDAAGDESADSNDPAQHQSEHTPRSCEDAVIVLLGRHDTLPAPSLAPDEKEKKQRWVTSCRKEGARGRRASPLFGRAECRGCFQPLDAPSLERAKRV